jgi:hypothetical protein
MASTRLNLLVSSALAAGVLFIAPAESDAGEMAGVKKVAAGLHSGHAFGPRLRRDGTWVAYGVRETVKGTFKTGYYARSLGEDGIFRSVWPNQHPTFDEGEGTASFTDLVDFEWAADGNHNAMVCLHKERGQEVLLEKLAVRFGGPKDQNQPKFSSQGDRVIAICQNEMGGTDLCVADTLDGSLMTQLTFTEEQEVNPEWHPKDAKVIHEYRNRLGGDIYVFDLDMFTHEPVFRAGTSDEILPSYSPDGEHIAFLSNLADSSKDQYDLYVTTPGAGIPTMVLKDVRRSKHSRGYAWDPLGRFLVAVSNDEAAGYPLMIVPSDGSTPPQSLNVPSKDNMDPVMVPTESSIRLVWVGISPDSKPDQQWRVVHVVDHDVSGMALLAGPSE